MPGEIYNIVGSDTLTIFDRVINDFADGDISTFVFNNDRSGVTTGKNGNTIFALDETGKNSVATLRIMMGSADDSFLQGILTGSDNDFASTILGAGEFVKNVGDGSGNIRRIVWTLGGGMMTKYIPGKGNVKGDTEQGVSVFTITFAKAIRSIQ